MTTCRALICERLTTDRSGMVVGPWPLAEPGAGQVRVRVHAAALNFPDLLMSAGTYQFKPEPEFVSGVEGAGVVDSVGDGVSGFKPGDRVFFGCRNGAIAEYAVLPVDSVRPAPPGWEHAEAAAWRVGALTAYVGLVRRGDLMAGETLLVHGASGGMGIAAVQLGRHLGATVIATGSSDDKLKAATAVGAHHVIRLDPQIKGGAFRDRVKALTGGAGADVIFDPVGGDVFDESLRCIAWGGRMLVIGFASGRISTVGVNMPLIKGYSIVGVRAGEYGRRDPVRGAQNWQAIEELARAGVFKPHIGARFPLDRALDAMSCLARRDVAGKVVIEM